MAPNSEILRFKFTSYGDSMLQKMNVLRQQNRFCDVTIKINNVAFVGHKIILAACSPFLRDQFLLNESKEVRISLLQSSEVGEQILRSCYTGALEFPVKELVNYLTAASYLQMGHIVERCTEALTKYIEPKLLSDDLGQASCCAEQSQDVPSPNSERNQLGDLSPSGDVSDCDTDSEDSNIRIVKVESLTSDVQEAESGTLRQLRAELGRASERRVASPPEPQHSLVNSTVDSRGHKAGSCLQSYGGSRPRDLTGDKWLQKPHQCSKCGKIFHHLENFISHLKTHKLFLCLRCGKIFTQKSNLTRHIRVHTGIKPYQCTICGKTFTQKCSLQDHLNLHSGDRPHKCNYCDVGFAHKPALRRHLKEQHGKKCVDNVTEGSIQEISLEVNTID
uniref:Zinc finger and BTB domain containing 26 n=1 Tax=Callorhinchus milii TaxID=7868 RepID=A0A4W3GW11_CALMI